ncbi:MAG: preprotein translocase subunit YajC [Mycobacteriales bacterium]
MIVPTSTLTDAAPVHLAAAKSGGGGYTGLLLLVALMIFTYFVLVRPQSRRKKQLQLTQASLQPGAEVMTTAGLFATVVDFDDESVTLETSPGVHNRYVRAAVAKIIAPVADADDASEGLAGDGFDEASDDSGDAPEDASRPKS